MKLVLYLHMHQPWRLARFRYLDLGSGRPYFDEARNLDIFRGIAERCYRPTLKILRKLLEDYPDFRVSLSITGTFIEQADLAAPDVLDLVRDLVRTGRTALVAETYYHSLAFLLPPPELAEEVAMHRQLLRDRFGADPKVLRMTELAYSDELARFAEAERFRGMLAEGWEGILGGRAPTHVYCASSAPTVQLLLRHYPLSDDIGFRFSAKGWSEYPLTSEKYVRWLVSTPGEVIGLFMDFETFGEHQHADSGIFAFLEALPRAVANEPSLSWATVDEAVALPPRDSISVPTTISWADQNRDLGAWLGNDLQRSAFEAAKKVGVLARRCGDAEILGSWRRLLTSDHFYYMYVGGHGADEGVHQYFSSYGSPFDAYANYMNALTDLRQRALARLRCDHYDPTQCDPGPRGGSPVIVQLAGNGRVLLTVNEEGAWNELFYPYPGQFQHLREMRLGVFEEEGHRFQWLSGPGGWLTPSAVVGTDDGAMRVWDGGGLTITVRDRVHPNHDLVIRTVECLSATPRKLRLFAYHSLSIAESMYQETAYVDVEAQALVHYKRAFYFEFFSDPPFDRAVCGEHTLKGLKGSFVDAEDGVLSGGAIAHGAADSVLQWDLTVVPDRPTRIRVMLAIGRSREAVRQVHEYVRFGGSRRFEAEAEAFWRTWATRRLPGVPSTLSELARAVYRQSVLVMRHASGTNGSVIASPDTRSLVVGGDTYNYCWWRDGGYISKAMDEAGLYQHAQRFLEFARSCQSPDGSFLHRHFPDGAIGSTWHPPPFLQIDQTATVVGATWHHFKRGADPDVLLDFWPMVKSAANFMVAFQDRATGLPAASFDLWEERRATHTYSTAAVIHALERAARVAEQLGKDPTVWRTTSQAMHRAALTQLWDEARGGFVRSIHERDDRVDASVLLALKLGLLPDHDPRTRSTVDLIESRLWNRKVGGLARYEGDLYYGAENPWIICTLWLAEARLRLGDREKCRELIEWVAAHATPTRMLPEQVDSGSGEPRSAVPLTWSHSTFVDVVHKYREALRDGKPSEE